MSKNPLKLNIAWLYPDVLQGFCDEANISAFYKRAKWRDIEISVNKIQSGEKISPFDYDFYYIGGTNTSCLKEQTRYLLKNAKELKVAAQASVPMLAVYCGYLLFGTSFQFSDEIQIKGLDILPVNSIESPVQSTGNIIGKCTFVKPKSIIGFENHSMATYLTPEARSFITVKKGSGNNGQDSTEGARKKNVIGTYISSPLLAQNPNFCDFLIARSLRVKYKCEVPLSLLNDDIEWYSHNYILEAN